MRDLMLRHKTLRALRGAICGSLLAALVSASATIRAAAEDGLKRRGEATAERALDGDTLVLADGRRLRLAGIMAPKDGDAGAAREIAAIAATATAELEKLAAGATLILHTSDPERDRHGRALAYVQRSDRGWLQDEMLRRGLARVFTQPGIAARAEAMLAIESEARAARRGLWALASYAVRGADDAGRSLDRFAIVEGTVLRAARAREFFYLNFDRDWRHDFTIGFDAAALRLFRRAGRDPALLEGKRVRVRGWVIARNGPYIGATHPEQIEVLE